MASVTAFTLTIVLGPIIIEMLRRLKVGQHIRREHVEELYQQHKHKTGTPTMGGFMILFSVIISVALWARLDNQYIILCLISMFGLGLVGFLDDYIKLVRERNMGLRASAKFAGQLLVAGFIAYYIYRYTDIPHSLNVPFAKHLILDLGIAYAVFIVLVIVGSSNAVNLTDGLDGLAIGCVTIIAIAYAIICYITGNAIASEYLNVFYLPGAGELTVFCAAIVGAGLGFLWFNAHPASVFMGDVGSLALGGVIGLISVIIKKELLLLFIGAIFVAEVMSVIIQVISVKTRKKRVFLMSPLHHHFQLQGIHESKIIIRFWVVSIILAFLSLAILKLQ